MSEHINCCVPAKSRHKHNPSKVSAIDVSPVKNDFVFFYLDVPSNYVSNLPGLFTICPAVVRMKYATDFLCIFLIQQFT